MSWSLFRRKPPRDPLIRQRIETLVLQALTLGSPVPGLAPTLTISEIDCGDIACPGLETIILILREGRATQAVKVKKPMAEVGEADIREALRAL